MPPKGINVPQFTRETKLDLLFQSLSQFIEIDENDSNDALTQLYDKIDQDGNQEETNRLVKLQIVMDKCFQYLIQIQNHSLIQMESNRKSNDPEKSHLITISLHDMKYFNELLNIIIIQGVYSCLPKGIGIPLEQRRLKNFNKKTKKFSYQKIPNSNELLLYIIKQLETIFDKGGDVKELLLKGSGLTDIFTGLITLILDHDSNLINVFNKFELKSDTYNLFSIYTILLQTTTNPKYQSFISERLTNLTINRSNGVITLIDFIVGIRDDEEINIDKFNNVNRILMSKPKNLSSVIYFNKLFDQIYEILVFVNRPIMLSVIVNFIRILYFKNKKIIQDFLFKRIWKLLNPITTNFHNGDTIVDAKQLNDVINVLISLTKETTPEFLNELYSQIILNLWAYYLYLRKKNHDFASILENLLTSFFTITSNNEFLENIILNLAKTSGENWEFQTILENKLSKIVKTNDLETISSEEIFDDLDVGLNSIVSILKNLDNDIIRKQFLIVLNRWITKQTTTVTTLNDENPFLILIDLKFLEKINDNFKDSLMDKPEDLLIVIEKLLVSKSLGKDALEIETNDNLEENGEVDSDDEDENDDQVSSSGGGIGVLLELLSAILSETNESELFKHKTTLEKISKILTKFSDDKQCIALHKRIEFFLKTDHKSTPINDELSKDKELLEKAITSINDPLTPIRAHGLYLLRQLIIKKSSVLTLDFVLELHIVQLQDQEPFIYLNVIRSLNELIEFDQEGTLEFLLKFYNNSEEKLDDRLKIGEVLIKFIEKSGELFMGHLANNVISTNLQIIRDFNQDNRIRMSSMSIIGQSLRTNAIGLDSFIKDALDCSIGILEFEKDVIMLRSSIVLINDLISFGGLEIVPRGYGEKLKNLLEYTKINPEVDYLLLEQINKVLEIINELILIKFKPVLNNQFDNLKIQELK
ncbi:hypothetical protein BN7_4674 [Wickerhamomyces ciferrii]|uniref:Uncharacterized protein n=1 Tax=Wickerhamomyces ciferrii (strain ATCC 14091 / BCRC 22168 / CBS 111 / JCM 3599 / NBRC 0793 / NRRL Y-1031 F-60-10) TaxID=1206466 RepID=K0KPZ0_WICCF|nr:uncharacterized protein BN7_4674 [Wickerhamomyces ciferrii]CCH45096.1 hypothetical protein BN7_4674 [Wickerhamomyces ciferrii]